MKTNFIKFVDNEKEFLTVGDLFDLFDVEKLDEKGQELYLKEKENRGESQILLAKIQEKNPIDVHGEMFVAVYFVSYSSKDLMMLIDRKSKFILLNPCQMFRYEGIRSFELYERVNKYALKSDLDGYSIHTVEEATNSFKELKYQLNEGLVEKHLEDILSCKNEEFEEESLLDEINFNYVMNKEILKKEGISFIGQERGSLLSHYDHQYTLLLAYYSTPSLLKEEMEKDFMKFISKESYDLSYKANRIHKGIRLKEVYELHKLSIESDELLNNYKQIISCLSKGGKTINVNGTKIDNKVGSYRGEIDEIYLGDYGNKVYLKDVEVIKFGRNELYKKS